MRRNGQDHPESAVALARRERDEAIVRDVEEGDSTWAEAAFAHKVSISTVLNIMRKHRAAKKAAAEAAKGE
jgi:hypothetical protein